MTTAQAIIEHLRVLPESAQQKVLDFVKSLESRRTETAQSEEDAGWSDLSLACAMRDMGDEESLYTLADLKETF